MNKKWIWVLVWVILGSTSLGKIQAAYGINRTINFQGKLVDSDGVNVPNSTPVTATFSIYETNSSCPGGGTAVWSENQNFTPVDGIFQVALGSVTPFGTSIDFSQDTLYLGIKISTEANEMCSGSSRIKLAAVPYAFNAESFAGLTADNSQNNYFTITGGQGTPATLTVNGNVTVGPIISPTSAGGLTVQSNGANTLTLDTGAGAAINIGTANSNAITLGRSGTGDSNGGLVKLPGGLVAQGKVAGKALVILDETGDQDILVASAGGATKFVVDRNGLVTAASGNFGSLTVTTNNSLNVSNYGIDFTDSDTNPSCAAGDYKIYADTSDNRLKKCQNGVVTDLARDADVIFKAKSADQSVSNSTTLADETALQFDMGGSEEWNVIWDLVVSNNNSDTPDWKAGVVGPASNTCEVVQSGSETAGVDFLQATTTDCIDPPGNLVNDAIAASAVPFNVRITGNITGGGTAGTVKMQFAENTSGEGTSITVKAGSTMTAYRVTGADLAEFYRTLDQTIEPGDVVALDGLLPDGVRKSNRGYDDQVMGVISTKPGLVMGSSTGENGGFAALVALSGRVPVKVTTENGPINPGDMLTASSTPGIAMKMTKAGQSIGMAMTGYDGIGTGVVTVFVRTGYAGGAKVVDLVARNGFESSAAAVLEYAREKSVKLSEDQWSELLTDRVVAGLEMITPKLTAEEIFVKKIGALSGEELVFEASAGARFLGGVTADWIKAKKIEGLEVLSEKFSFLEDQVASLSGGLVAVTPTATPVEALDLTVLGDLIANGSLLAKGPTTFTDEVVFKKNALFENGPIFGKDTVGFAVIGRGNNRVDIVFDSEYLVSPMVSVNMAFSDLKRPDGSADEEANSLLEKRVLGENYTYVVTRKTTKGFTIMLNKQALDDIAFSWIALTAKEPRTFSNILDRLDSMVPSATPVVPTPTVTILPTPQEVATDSANAMPP
jgi:hypothetical protein